MAPRASQNSYSLQYNTSADILNRISQSIQRLSANEYSLFT